MPAPGYSTRSARPSARPRSRRTSQATTYVDPAYAYNEREALLDSTRRGLHSVQQTYVKPIWDYDPKQVWTRKSSPNIPPLEHFLAEARAKYNHTDPTFVNPLSAYWSQGGYEYGYPHGISPPHREDNVNPQLSYRSSGRSRRTDRSSTLIGRNGIYDHNGIHNHNVIRDHNAIREAQGVCLYRSWSQLGRLRIDHTARRPSAHPGHQRDQLGLRDHGHERRLRIRVGTTQEFRSLFKL
ncbi:hypothetical protein E2P81_ATG04003 [Venturia nashicola]|nr:hypothetical protein E2P81_ATG04003 [Venturia nashicola]